MITTRSTTTSTSTTTTSASMAAPARADGRHQRLQRSPVRKRRNDQGPQRQRHGVERREARDRQERPEHQNAGEHPQPRCERGQPLCMATMASQRPPATGARLPRLPRAAPSRAEPPCLLRPGPPTTGARRGSPAASVAASSAATDGRALPLGPLAIRSASLGTATSAAGRIRKKASTYSAVSASCRWRRAERRDWHRLGRCHDDRHRSGEAGTRKRDREHKSGDRTAHAQDDRAA